VTSPVARRPADHPRPYGIIPEGHTRGANINLRSDDSGPAGRAPWERSGRLAGRSTRDPTRADRSPGPRL